MSRAELIGVYVCIGATALSLACRGFVRLLSRIADG